MRDVEVGGRKSVRWGVGGGRGGGGGGWEAYTRLMWLGIGAGDSAREHGDDHLGAVKCR